MVLGWIIVAAWVHTAAAQITYFGCINSTTNAVKVSIDVPLTCDPGDIAVNWNQTPAYSNVYNACIDKDSKLMRYRQSRPHGTPMKSFLMGATVQA